MGQYFHFVNISKREYLVPWCCGDGAKLVEITTGNMPALLAYLLKQSTDSTGCPYDIAETKDLIQAIKSQIAKDIDEQKNTQALQKQLREEEARLKSMGKIFYCGRWAGDRITLVGDYDDSKLYDETAQMENITHAVMEEYNQFVGIESCMVFTSDWHTCDKYRSKEDFEQTVSEIDNYRVMIKEGRCTPASHGYEQIDRIKDAIALKIAEDEYYGKYIEPKWKYQLPKSDKKQQKKGLMAPDMVFSVGKKESDE